ncbi:MAG: glycosyltransferase family 39 protein [Acidobacteriota bacterium]
MACCLLFLLLGLVVLPYPGFQTDEVLFSSVIYEPRYLEGWVQIFKHRVPTMVMSYIGSLKALLYIGLFKLWPPSPWSVRLPVIVAGAATVWLFFLLLRDTLGRRAAVAGAAMLATDTTFLLTTTFDWGPVALQHLLLVGGLVLLVRSQRVERRPNLALAGAFFLFGLGLWDKAIFVWMLSGLGLALLVVYPRELLRALSLRRVVIALTALCLGATPLIIYNARSGGATFAGAQYSGERFATKARFLVHALDGSSLFGYVVREDTGHRRSEAPDPLERISLAASDAAGQPRINLLVPALALAVALLPFIWRTPARRVVLFALIGMAVGWLQMALTRDAGGSTHHVVLLWPFPHLVIAAAFAAASRRLRRFGLAALAVVLAVLCASNLLVTNEHLAQFVRNGGPAIWTDAVYPLTTALEEAGRPPVTVLDWGIVDCLRILGRGRLPLHQAIDLASKETLNPADRRSLDWSLSSPQRVFVSHTAGEEAIPGVGARFEAHASQAGFRKELLRVIHDRHGRPVFEVSRFRQAGQAPATSAPARR